jgi:anaerobic dimethyl sulfoxide reductase subunit B (iron-sulfur subunit)
MTQYGFFIDQSRCIGCNACTVACMQWHDIPPSPVKWMRVYQWEQGRFPNVELRMLPVMCYHCENPLCVKACQHGALVKEDTYGAVLVDSDKCEGCRSCWKACPYGAPQFESDDEGAKMSKCTMCMDRLKEGLTPICVLSCSMRALEFGPLAELIRKYGDLRRLEDMPKDSITRPAAVFKPAAGKKQVIPWDPQRALKLWQKRHPESGEALPDVFADLSEVTRAPTDIVGRNKLVLKAKDSAGLMYYTSDNE